MATVVANVAGPPQSPSGSTVDSPTFTGTLGSGTGAVLYSGTYTPTVTGVANIAASTPLACQYERSGNIVTVSGGVTFQPTAASVITRLDISLPIASNFTLFNNLGGTAANSGTAGACAVIFGETTGKKARLEYTNAADTASRNWCFIFQYLIV